MIETTMIATCIFLLTKYPSLQIQQIKFITQLTRCVH